MRSSTTGIKKTLSDDNIEAGTTTELPRKTSREKIDDAGVAAIEGATWTGLSAVNGVMTSFELNHLNKQFSENGHRHMQADYEADRFSAINLFALLYMMARTGHCLYQNWEDLSNTDRVVILFIFAIACAALFSNTFFFGESANVKETAWVTPSTDALLTFSNIYMHGKAALKARSAPYATIESKTDGEKEKIEESRPVFTSK